MLGRESFRKDFKHYFGFRRQNLTLNTVTSTYDLVFKVTPMGIAKLSSIIQKAITIIGRLEPFRKDKAIEGHPLIRYVINIFILYQGMAFDDDIQKLKRKVVKQLGDSKSLRALTEEVFEEVIKQKSLLSYESKDRYQRLLLFENMINSETQKAINDTLAFMKKQQLKFELPDKQKPLLFYRKYVEELLEQVRSLQPLTEAQQMQKYKMFQKKHKKFFKANLAHSHIQRNYFFQIGRLSSEAEPVLQRISQFVDLRFETSQYRTQSVNFVRQVYSQLLQYQKIVSSSYENGTVRFSCLNPECVVVDQFSLKPRLHFQTLLQQAIGLRGKPYSVECRLAFEPTAKGFDYYRAPIQLSDKFQRKAKDPFYGNLELYQNQRQYLTRMQREKIQDENKQLSIQKEYITVWRFLLTSYFIVHNQQFGRLPDSNSQRATQQHFLQCLRDKEKQLRTNAQGLSLFIGFQNNKIDNNPFQFTFEDIGQYLSVQKDDSLIQSHHFQKMAKYCAIRMGLIREIQFYLLGKGPCFKKVINIKKFCMFYLVAGMEMMEDEKRLVQCQRQRTGSRKPMRRHLQTYVGHLGRTNSIDSLTVYYQRILQYTRRNATDQGFKYLKQGQGHLLDLINKLQQKSKQLSELVQILNIYQEKSQVQNRDKYREVLGAVYELTLETLPIMKGLLNEIAFIQFQQRSKVQKLHKLTTPIQHNNIQGWELLTKRFLMILYSYLTINQDNYSIYDSLVIPLLRYHQSPAQKEPLPPSENHIQEEKNDLEAVQYVIGYQKLKPKELKHMRHRQKWIQSLV